MEDRLVLDTDILIDLLRGKDYAVDLVASLETKKQLAATDINPFYA